MRTEDPAKLQAAIEVTEFISVPPNAPNYKFVLTFEGDVFWVPPFEVAGGMRWGEAWDTYEDAPTHYDVMLDVLGFSDIEEGQYGFGYCLDGEIQVWTDIPISKYANKIFEWFPDKEYIEWDGSEVALSSLEWFRAASGKKQKQRKRRNRSKQRSTVPYYGAWWGGWNPGMVFNPGDFHSGGGTTEQQTGGDFGGGGFDGG